MGSDDFCVEALEEATQLVRQPAHAVRELLDLRRARATRNTAKSTAANAATAAAVAVLRRQLHRHERGRVVLERVLQQRHKEFGYER